MTATKEKALLALLDARTKTEAAKNAGISCRTLNRYMKDNEFTEAVRAVSGFTFNSAARQAQSKVNSAIEILHNVAANENENGMTRTAAASALLDFALKLSEKQSPPAILSGIEQGNEV